MGGFPRAAHTPAGGIGRGGNWLLLFLPLTLFTGKGICPEMLQPMCLGRFESWESLSLFPHLSPSPRPFSLPLWLGESDLLAPSGLDQLLPSLTGGEMGGPEGLHVTLPVPSPFPEASLNYLESGSGIDVGRAWGCPWGLVPTGRGGSRFFPVGGNGVQR